MALFRKGTEFRTEFTEVAFAPAWSMFGRKVAGRVKFDDATLEKGVLQDGSDAAALDLVRLLVKVDAITGEPPVEHMRDVEIVRYNRSGNET